MAQAGYTPIQLYFSSTASAVPTAGNLIPGELALNTNDGKLYYKDSGGLIKTLADSSTATGNLPGGTAGALVYQSAPSTTTYLPIGSANYLLVSNGTTPAYVSPASVTVGTAALANFATLAGSASTATTATTANNIASGNANQLLYQQSSGVTNFAPAPTTPGYVLGWNGSAFQWIAAPSATSAINIAGGLANQIPFQSAPGVTAFNAALTFNAGTTTLGSTNITATNTVSGASVTATGAVTGATVTATGAVTGDTVVATKTITGSANFGAYAYGTLSYSDTNIFASYATDVNSYAQKIIQNKNAGATASVDYIVSNDQGTGTTYYGDFGMNSSTFSGVGPFQLPNAVYLYSTDSDLVIGTKTAHYLRLVTNDNAADSITVSPVGAVAFNGDYGVTGKVLGSNGTLGAPTWVDAGGAPSFLLINAGVS